MGIAIEFDNSGPASQESAFPDEDEAQSFPYAPLELRSARARSDTERSSSSQSRPGFQPRSRSLSRSSGVPVRIADAARLISRQPHASHLGESTQRSPSLATHVNPGPDTTSTILFEHSVIKGDGEAHDAASPEGSEDDISHGTDDVPGDDKELEERVAQIEELHLASLGVKFFKDWYELAAEAGAKSPPPRQAPSSISTTTVEKLLSHWKAYMEWKRATVEEASRKEAYNQRCDRLSTRARQIYILTTTLTLWHQYASYRAERTAVARRHILRLRHFDSWNSLVISEERAVRIFTQSLHFPRWVDRHHFLCRQDNFAFELNRDNLLAKSFNTWQLVAFEGSLQSTRSQRLKESAFGHWLQRASSAQETDSSVQNHSWEKSIVAFTHRWKTLASCLGYQDDNSLARFRERALTKTFRFWIMSSRPRQVNDGQYTTNLLSTIFDTWHLETQVRAFKRQQNYRCLTETFISWMTFQKLATFQSQRESLLKETAFELFLHGSNEIKARGCQSRMLQAARYVSHDSITCLYQIWSGLAVNLKAAGDTEYNSTTDASKAAYIDSWFGAALRHAELDRWARRGHSYLAVHGNFDSWKHWARRKRERKLRETYTKLKHSTNVRLVLGCWRIWKEKYDVASTLEEAVEGERRSHDRRLLLVAMDRWISSAHHDTSTEQRCQHLVIDKFFDKWVIAAAEHTKEEAETTRLWVERALESCWSRWDIAHQWTGGQAYNADNAAQRRDRDLTTRTFLRWLNIAIPDRSEAWDDASRGINSFGRSDIGPAMGRTRYQHTPARVQPWSRSNLLDYNARISSKHSDNLDDESDSVVEGINTPTRWGGLTRPVVGLPSTTPSAPLSTPYERELRIRYAAGASTIGRPRGGADTHDSGVSSGH